MTYRSYLDFNSTAPNRPEVIDAVVMAMRKWGNASSVHADGRAARSYVEEARKKVAELVGGSSKNVVFTSSGTESNNQAIRAISCERIIVSGIEHESVLRAREDTIICPVKSNGIIDLAALEALLFESKKQTVISIMLANNETGILQPILEVSRLARKAGAYFHCDAVQAAGKIPIDIGDLGVDSLALSAHKIGGPQGVGALVCKDTSHISRFIHGGGQESGLRAGTENVPGIVGYGVAAESALLGLPAFYDLRYLRDDLEQRVFEIDPETKIFGKGLDRLPNTSKFATKGLSSELQVMGLDLDGVSISAGSACSSGKIETPYVLAAMGVPEELGLCAIRVSLGWTTTPEDIDRFIVSWENLRNRKMNKS
ncbi:MAG: cysteine desulfurase family protein [Pseudomonadota bacterium]|nr:cysteine desulfurase family protein [Pseudomonadota bacterium]